jgi:hypothetical protein
LATTRYTVRGAHVIHEAIEGEVVIINLETGNYYSLRGSGARVWEGIVAGAATEAIARDLVAAFDGLEAPPDLAAFLGELEREGLVGAVSGEGAGELPGAAGPRQAFAPPALERFTDMQDLILLDPVHEVDEAQGWPHAKPAEPA